MTSEKRVLSPVADQAADGGAPTPSSQICYRRGRLHSIAMAHASTQTGDVSIRIRCGIGIEKRVTIEVDSSPRARALWCFSLAHPETAMLYFTELTHATNAGSMLETTLDDYFRQYGLIAIFGAVAVAVPSGLLLASWMLSLVGIRPQLPNPIKQSIYECGFETLSGKWSQFNFRYYSLALLFVIFDVEVVFLFPWAASFGVLSREFGLFALLEMVVFIGILVVGWLYAWRKGSLSWD